MRECEVPSSASVALARTCARRQWWNRLRQGVAAMWTLTYLCTKSTLKYVPVPPAEHPVRIMIIRGKLAGLAGSRAFFANMHHQPTLQHCEAPMHIHLPVNTTCSRVSARPHSMSTTSSNDCKTFRPRRWSVEPLKVRSTVPAKFVPVFVRSMRTEACLFDSLLTQYFSVNNVNKSKACARTIAING